LLATALNACGGKIESVGGGKIERGLLTVENLGGDTIT